MGSKGSLISCGGEGWLVWANPTDLKHFMLVLIERYQNTQCIVVCCVWGWTVADRSHADLCPQPKAPVEALWCFGQHSAEKLWVLWMLLGSFNWLLINCYYTYLLSVTAIVGLIHHQKAASNTDWTEWTEELEERKGTFFRAAGVGSTRD